MWKHVSVRIVSVMSRWKAEVVLVNRCRDRKDTDVWAQDWYILTVSILGRDLSDLGVGCWSVWC